MYGSHTAKDIPYLFAPVDQNGNSYGRHTDTIARVTVQVDDGPEHDAIMRDGFWFHPGEEDPLARSVELPDDLDALPDQERQERMEEIFAAAPNNGLIGIPYGYVLRGYDASGALVYDSSVDGPSVEECYTDPQGAEVIASFDVDAPPAPSSCRPTVEWVR
jgi:hypothetical protein